MKMRKEAEWLVQVVSFDNDTVVPDVGGGESAGNFFVLALFGPLGLGCGPFLGRSLWWAVGVVGVPIWRGDGV